MARSKISFSIEIFNLDRNLEFFDLWALWAGMMFAKDSTDTPTEVLTKMPTENRTKMPTETLAKTPLRLSYFPWRSMGNKRDKLKGQTKEPNSQIFADFCRFSLFLGITAFRRRRSLQKTAGNCRFSQKTAGNRRFSQKPVCPISLSLVIPPKKTPLQMKKVSVLKGCLHRSADWNPFWGIPVSTVIQTWELGTHGPEKFKLPVKGYDPPDPLQSPIVRKTGKLNFQSAKIPFFTPVLGPI